MREYRTNRTHFCLKEEMGAVDVPLKLTAYHADSRFGSVVVGAAPSVDAPNAEKGNNWTSPSPCRGMDNTEWNHAQWQVETSAKKW